MATTRSLAHARLGTVFALYLTLIAAYVCFLPGLHGPFLLDDFYNIERTAVESLTWSEIKGHIFWGPHLDGAARSLTNLSFALTQFFSGYEPFPFKQQNLLLHLINGLLVFWLISLLLGRVESNRARAEAIALSVTALWLLHPIQVSTVLYAVQRLVLLSALFVLSALICYVKGRILSETRPWLGFTLALLGVSLFGGLGIISKENAALVPLYIATIEYFFFRFPAEDKTQRRLLYLVLSLIVALPLLGASVYILLNAQNYFVTAYAGREFDIYERLMTQTHVLLLYVKLFLFPLPSQMSLFHDNFAVQTSLDLPTLGLALAYLAAIIAALWGGRRYPAIGFGVLWFFACHMLESTFLPLEMVFEHRNYLALLGLSLTLICLFMHLLGSKSLTRVRIALLLALSVLLGFNTAARAFVWSDLQLMMHTEYQERPDSLRVLSSMYYLAFKQGDIDGARKFIREAQRLEPHNPAPFVEDLMTYCPEPAPPEALVQKAVSLLSTATLSAYAMSALHNLTQAHLGGACPGLDSAEIHALNRAATDNERILLARSKHVSLIDQGDLFIQQQRWADAEAVYLEAIDLAASFSPAFMEITINKFFAPFFRAGQIDALGNLLTRAELVNAESSAPAHKGDTHADSVWARYRDIVPEWKQQHLERVQYP